MHTKLRNLLDCYIICRIQIAQYFTFQMANLYFFKVKVIYPNQTNEIYN
jgi:hypothetical protein